MISSIFAQFGAWIVSALAVVGAILVGVRSQKKIAKADAEKEIVIERANQTVKQVQESAKVETETVKGVNDVQNEISKLGNSDVNERLRNEWARD